MTTNTQQPATQKAAPERHRRYSAARLESAENAAIEARQRVVDLRQALEAAEAALKEATRAALRAKRAHRMIAPPPAEARAARPPW